MNEVRSCLNVTHPSSVCSVSIASLANTGVRDVEKSIESSKKFTVSSACNYSKEININISFNK